MTVTLGTVVVAPLANGSSNTTFSVTSNSNPLYVEVAWWTNAITGITYGGAALSPVSQSGASSGGDRAEIWVLLNPTPGTANIVASHGVQAAGSIAAYNSLGQNVGSPHNNPSSAVSAANAANTATQNLTGVVTGDLTICAVANGNGEAMTPLAGTGTPTELFDSPSNGEGAEGFSASANSSSISATWTTATSWAMAYVTLKAAPAGPIGISPTNNPSPFPHPPLSAGVDR